MLFLHHFLDLISTQFINKKTFSLTMRTIFCGGNLSTTKKGKQFSPIWAILDVIEKICHQLNIHCFISHEQKMIKIRDVFQKTSDEKL